MKLLYLNEGKLIKKKTYCISLTVVFIVQLLFDHHQENDQFNSMGTLSDPMNSN
jgi:hypothetical protein